jgi:hypothetical protein
VALNSAGETGFLGKAGFELQNFPAGSTRNTATEIAGRVFSGHSLDKMQNIGIMPSVVENTIQTGVNYATKAGTVGYYDSVNYVRTILNSAGDVITVIRGAP